MACERQARPDHHSDLRVVLPWGLARGGTAGTARVSGPRGGPAEGLKVSGLRRSMERAEDAFVTQREAAELCQVSRDTIVRARQAGRFPHARFERHTWTIPTADLAAAGLYDPASRPQPGPAAPVCAPVAATALPVPADVSLARAEARVGALEELLARQDAELAFLRQLTADTLARKAS